VFFVLHANRAKFIPHWETKSLRKARKSKEEKQMRKSVYEIVTNKIIKQLEKGVVPWRKPWINGGAVNWKTQKLYRGINAFFLEISEYATFTQIQEAGGKVKKAQNYILWSFGNG
jgi:antirestriction protein ArdC